MPTKGTTEGRAAAAHYAHSLDAAARSGDRIEICLELQGVAMACAGLGQPEWPLRIAGAADAQFQSMGFQFSVAFWTALLDHHLGEARSALGPEAEAVWQAGQRLSLQEAVAEASASQGLGEPSRAADAATIDLP